MTTPPLPTTPSPNYTWISTGESGDEFTPVYYLAQTPAHPSPPSLSPCWTAVALTPHLIHRLSPNPLPPTSDPFKTIVDPICFGASTSTPPGLHPPRSRQLLSYFAARGLSDFSILTATTRVSLGRGTIVDAFGAEWDAVASGAIHVEDLQSRIDATFIGGPPDVIDRLVGELLESVIQVFIHEVGGLVNMLRVLRAVRVARLVRSQCSVEELKEFSVDEFSVLRVKEGGVSTWTVESGGGGLQIGWQKAREVLRVVIAGEDGMEREGGGVGNCVAELVGGGVGDEREEAACDLGLVLGWIVQTGYWNVGEVRSSLLLDAVYEGGTVISSAGVREFLGVFADMVNAWVEEGTLELGPSLKIRIDEVGPVSPYVGFNHEAAGFLKVGRIAEGRCVGGIRVVPGRGLETPSSDSVTVRMGGRQRLRVVGGVLVNQGGWRMEKMVSRAELGLSAGVPGLSVGCDLEFSKASTEKVEEYVVNGIFEGAMGKEAAFWLLGKLRHGDLAVSPETSVSYSRERKMRIKKGGPLVDSGLDPKCVQLLHSYTDDKRVYVDFENNGNLRQVSIGKDGFMNVAKRRASYNKEEMSECTIVSRRRMR